MKKTTLIALLACLFGLCAKAQTFSGSEPKAGKTYYIYNVGAGKWLTEGDNWGTHASLDDLGTPLRLVAQDDAFAIATSFGSGYMNLASDGVWLDQSTKFPWIFTAVEGTDYYTIGDSTQLLRWGGSGTKVSAATTTASNANAQWMLVLDSDREDALSQASYANPLDATFCLPNARFNVSYSGTAWTGTAFTAIGGFRNNTAGTSGGNDCAEQYQKTFDTYQTISVESGVWGVKVQGFTRSTENIDLTGALLYLNEAETVLPSFDSETGVDQNISGAATAFQNGKFQSDEVKVIALNGKLTIGIKKDQFVSLDWTAVDNFQLTYYGNTVDDCTALVEELVVQATNLCDQPLSAEARTALQAAISAYDGTATYTKPKLRSISKKLNQAITAAKRSAALMQALQQAISDGQEALGDASGNNPEPLQQAISNGQNLYGNTTDSTDEQLEQAIEDIENAITNYGFDNATGTVPTVTTDTRYARGVTMAFGRMTVSGVATSQIKERGFCFATHPNPTYTDGHSSRTLTSNGLIYWMENLQPATMYYMRPYCITTGNAIGYGDEIKFSTLPEGKITFSVRDTGTADDIARITSASEQAKYWWDNLTSINGFNVNAGYDGVPTADCSYGGYVRYGGAGYQTLPTTLHEWGHGIGMGYDKWWGDIKEYWWTGRFWGKRTTRVLRFWDNSTTEYLASPDGDASHMTPYGFNGGTEVYGTSEKDYIANSIIVQALSEDNFIPVAGKFCLPAYVFLQEDTLKYFIKNSSDDYGLTTSYLVAQDDTLAWVEMTDAEALQEGSHAAWTITFTPSNQYYQFKNADTQKYLNYTTSGFSVQGATVNSTTNIHLLLSFVDGELNGETYDIYHLIHPASTDTPYALGAAENGATQRITFSNTNDAAAQRWLIIAQDAVENRATAIGAVSETPTGTAQRQGIYTLDGRLVSRNTADLTTLQPGIYIINGKKVVR